MGDRTSEWYRYMPLQAGQVGLLHLKATPDPGSVEFSLSVQSLDDDDDDDDNVQFEALSYTWGDCSDLHSVSCQGATIQVTRNLLGALRQLKHPDRDRTFWIDAVCINQGDEDEKSIQVAMMRNSYRKADGVVIWLGEVADDTPGAWQLLHHLAWVVGKAAPGDWAKPVSVEELGSLGLPPGAASEWEALEAIFWRQWFTRVWIIQEISLARTASVHCGQFSMPWEWFAAAVGYVHNRQFNQLTACELDMTPAMSLSYIARQVREGGGTHDLISLLAASRRSIATDPRDHVYGLLRMVASHQMLVPDYTLAAAETYRQLTAMLLLEGLDVLSLKGDIRWNRQEGLPSWVPDWSSYQRAYGLIFGSTAQNENMRACGDTTAKPRFSDDGKTLWLQGTVVDEVKHVGGTFMRHGIDHAKPIPRLVGPELMQQSQHWIVTRSLRIWEKMALDLKTYPTGESIESAYHHTLVGGVDLAPKAVGGAAMSDLYSAYWWHHLKFPGESQTPSPFTPDEVRKNALLYEHTMFQVAYYRRLFVTKQGYIGLGPNSMKAGDNVVLFCGGRTAYILRPRQNKNPSTSEFLGESYVRGMMNGECFSGDSTLQEFAIE
jgi:hypothetical protein